MFSYSLQMLATLLIFRQFLQNIKEVLQPYLYEQNKLGVFTPKVLWELLQAIVLKYGRLALGKAQASMTAYSFLGPRGIPVGHSANSNPQAKRRGDLKAGFRLSEEEWDMSDSALKQRKVSFTEKVDYQDVTMEAQAGDDCFLQDSPTMVEEGMDPSIFDSCDEDSDCELLSYVCGLLIIIIYHLTLQLSSKNCFLEHQFWSISKISLSVWIILTLSVSRSFMN